ncbi:thiamine phosphate synthase [Beijerinckia sp. L45]|uniref:thiamine phosphate synthase n=1 Tax=Beijerinckia sp. L45 TaxID=1641855 RepID=UPI001FEEF691|nr:thiamine phosphate synthase [Beijerinckia sp. L45]
MLDPFYLIVDSAAWIARLLPHGVKLVQLRVKDQSADVVHREIAGAKRLCDAAGAQLVVNDYWQAAIELRCDYVHLGQEDLDEADLPAIRRAGIKLGVSTHDEDELERALATKPDYVALGPVYPTILKKMPFAPQGLDKLGVWKRKLGTIPLVGIGGVSLERAPGVLEAGADVAAVVTDITLNADPEARTCAWVAATSKFRRT